MSDHAAAIRGLPRWHPNPVIRSTIDTIRRCGWQVTSVGEGSPEANSREADCGFSYTAGLSLHSIPELAVYGVDPLTAHHVLNELGDLLHREDWRDLVATQTDIRLQTVAVSVRLIEQVDKDELILANLLFPDSPTLQVVWPDEYGRFPWEEGYVLLPMHQPVKGIPDLSVHARQAAHVVTVESGPDRTRPRRGRRISGH
ncbi:DUF4262 domain-containing protein [Gordonia rubripertincta]|uniref:DUF4262 domain-containing protein n=2 Tax=Gordonia rubripertincta TaxID=36822 RepID=A0AAW6R6C5_GORRU|nr:DUF4262 domain-containing protein [Gordonia rubripertincta]MDG6781867.1 DUF4262 domain-containing protein [Gordonia rubripertincta]NKY64899.1 DUF4262 domain-containing protein [Gordonia rubripertincta]GAB85263.1 hypothetical protein GORBP_055_00890 [Gordonia rubripertincta NBRC 101908]